jgi:thioredoxin 1
MPLFSAGAVVAAEAIFDVDLEDFDDRVIRASSDVPVLVDLWAEWCSPCLVIAPVLKQLVAENEGRIRLAKVEVDEEDNMKLAGRYKVRGFPTLILFVDGEEVDRFSGAKPLSYVQAFIDQHID